MGRKVSRRGQLAVLAALVLAGGSLYGAGWLSSGLRASEPIVGAAPGAGRATGTFTPSREEWANLQTETVAARQFRPEHLTEGSIALDDDLNTPVFSPYSGRVVRLLAELGEHVERGAPLFAVEANESVQGANALIAASAADKTAHSQLAQAEVNEKRAHQLYLANGGALKDWQQSRTDLAAAQNAARSADVALAAARNQLRILGKSESEVAALEDQPTRQLDPVAVVSAPITGTVTQRQVGLGQYIQSVSLGASTPVYTIGRVFAARLSWVAPAIDPNTHRLPVRAVVDNPAGVLKPMMFATFTIVIGEPTTAAAVPQSAVVYEGERARVWVAGDDGTLALRQIRPGQTRNGMVEIVSGVSVGEKVVTKGTVFIDRAGGAS
jgi:membrane fusion protein, heavy metal efflux system